MTTPRDSKITRLLDYATIGLSWLLPVFAWAPLTYPGYFEFHSGFLPAFNLNNLARHLVELSWAPVIGRPYDLLRGEGALPYLLALLPKALGASSVTAVKWLFATGILLGAVGMYGWARRRLGPWPGLLASAVYAFWPLGLATVYVRGAFAEAFLLGLMPWVLWAADVTAGRAAGATADESGRADAIRPYKSGIFRAVGPAIGLALALAAAFWTQAGLALWLAVLVLGYILASRGLRPAAAGRDQGGSLMVPLFGWLGGLVLAAAGLLPLLLRRGLGGGAWPTFADHFVYPHQLLLAGWGNGPSIPGPDDTLTFQLGLVACGLAILGIVMGQGRARWTCLPVLTLAFLSTTLAAPLWKSLPFLARTLTYPWQLLLLTGPWLAWLAGRGGHVLQSRHTRPTPVSPTPFFAALIALALLGVYGDLNPPTTNAAVADTPVAIFGDNEIMLLSATPAGVPGPGGTVTLTVRWQALQPPTQDYTVFFHVETPDGAVWGQQDTMPQAGQLPTAQWRPGQVVRDQYQVRLRTDAPVGADYSYLLGLYQWQTGQRLRTGTDDKVVLTP